MDMDMGVLLLLSLFPLLCLCLLGLLGFGYMKGNKKGKGERK